MLRRTSQGSKQANSPSGWAILTKSGKALVIRWHSMPLTRAVPSVEKAGLGQLQMRVLVRSNSNFRAIAIIWRVTPPIHVGLILWRLLMRFRSRLVPVLGLILALMAAALRP